VYRSSTTTFCQRISQFEEEKEATDLLGRIGNCEEVDILFRDRKNALLQGLSLSRAYGRIKAATKMICTRAGRDGGWYGWKRGHGQRSSAESQLSKRGE